MRTSPRSWILLLSFLGVGCSSSDQESHESARIVQPVVAADFDTKMPLGLVMEHVISPAAFGAWDASGFEVNSEGIVNLEPKSDAEWETTVNHTATLRESANLLLLPGRPIDEKWKKLVGDYRAVTQRMMAAAEAHDGKAYGLAGDDLVAACEACHQNYNITAKHYTRPVDPRSE